MSAADIQQIVSYLPDIHRLLPQAVEAEQGVLCSILIASDYAMERCDEKRITAGAFHVPAHAMIFAALLVMHCERHPIDAVTTTQWLRDRGSLDQCGGASFITGLSMFIGTAANVGYYADTLAVKHALRQLIATCTEYAARGYDEQHDVPGLLDEFESRALAIAGARHEGDASGIVEVAAMEGAKLAIAAIEDLYERRGKISGLETGFHELDVLTDGLHPADFVVIGARPSMGKTALLMDMALHAALEGRQRVAVFSAEMSAAQLYQRALCSLARVNVRNVRDGLLTDRDFPALTSASVKLAGSRLVILDAVGASINAVRARARRLHRKEPLGLIVVDYLQKLRHPPASKFREREIAEVSEGLKNLNKELQVPVVTAAQINRQGADGPPKMHHLRESGSIEADADVVLLLDRPEVYATGNEEKKELEGIANVEIAKQRNGPLGDVRLTFLKEFTRFETRAREAEPERRDYHGD